MQNTDLLREREREREGEGGGGGGDMDLEVPCPAGLDLDIYIAGASQWIGTGRAQIKICCFYRRPPMRK